MTPKTWLSLNPDLQLQARKRPQGRPAMHQEWQELLFMHFAVPPEEVQALLPEGLTVDVFPDSEGRQMAWIGLVPFTMRGIRPVGTPALPWISAFHETNVRTYVLQDGKDPGVWFFSLDAARWLACMFARLTFSLPYHHAQMSLRKQGDLRSYESVRAGRSPHLLVKYEIGEPLPAPQPGSLDFFLVERYRLYAMKSGRLHDGLVHHSPYPLRRATVTELDETYIASTGLLPRPIQHVRYSSGVKVSVWPLRRR